VSATLQADIAQLVILAYCYITTTVSTIYHHPLFGRYRQMQVMLTVLLKHCLVNIPRRNSFILQTGKP
jgi:hypothetical protein